MNIISYLVIISITLEIYFIFFSTHTERKSSINQSRRKKVKTTKINFNIKNVCISESKETNKFDKINRKCKEILKEKLVFIELRKQKEIMERRGLERWSGNSGNILLVNAIGILETEKQSTELVKDMAVLTCPDGYNFNTKAAKCERVITAQPLVRCTKGHRQGDFCVEMMRPLSVNCPEGYDFQNNRCVHTETTLKQLACPPTAQPDGYHCVELIIKEIGYVCEKGELNREGVCEMLLYENPQRICPPHFSLKGEECIKVAYFPCREKHAYGKTTSDIHHSIKHGKNQPVVEDKNDEKDDNDDMKDDDDDVKDDEKDDDEDMKDDDDNDMKDDDNDKKYDDDDDDKDEKYDDEDMKDDDKDKKDNDNDKKDDDEDRSTAANEKLDDAENERQQNLENDEADEDRYAVEDKKKDKKLRRMGEKKKKHAVHSPPPPLPVQHTVETCWNKEITIPVTECANDGQLLMGMCVYSRIFPALPKCSGYIKNGACIIEIRTKAKFVCPLNFIDGGNLGDPLIQGLHSEWPYVVKQKKNEPDPNYADPHSYIKKHGFLRRLKTKEESSFFENKENVTKNNEKRILNKLVYDEMNDLLKEENSIDNKNVIKEKETKSRALLAKDSLSHFHAAVPPMIATLPVDTNSKNSHVIEYVPVNVNYNKNLSKIDKMNVEGKKTLQFIKDELLQEKQISYFDSNEAGYCFRVDVSSYEIVCPASFIPHPEMKTCLYKHQPILVCEKGFSLNEQKGICKKIEYVAPMKVIPSSIITCRDIYSCANLQISSEAYVTDKHNIKFIEATHKKEEKKHKQLLIL